MNNKAVESCPIQYIIVAGNIGTGKTTLCRRLRSSLSSTPLIEQRDVHLRDFYRDPSAFAFRNQLAYSIQFLEQAVQIAHAHGLVLQERSIFDTHDVFSRLHWQEGRIEDGDYHLLSRLAEAAKLLVKPNLLVFLKAPVDVCWTRVRARADPDEALLSKPYLATLEKQYASWFEQFTLCEKRTFDTADVSPAELATLVCKALGDRPSA